MLPLLSLSVNARTVPNTRSPLYGESVSISADGQSILVGAPDATVALRNGTNVYSAGQAYLFNGEGELLHTFADTSPSMSCFFASTVGDSNRLRKGISSWKAFLIREIT